MNDPLVDLRIGDCREVLRELPAASVQCVVTSPPYFGLRDYQTATWEGGREECDHIMPVSFKSSTLGASTGGRSEETHARSIGAQATPYRDLCGKCGARRLDAQLGLERTPDCGRRGLYRLRAGLTEEQREYVVRRLLGEARRDA